MQDESELETLFEAALAERTGAVLIDKYLEGLEVEVDAICDGIDVLIPGIMEHVERAGVHSGDSMAVYPPQNLTAEQRAAIIDYTVDTTSAVVPRGSYIATLNAVLTDAHGQPITTLPSPYGNGCRLVDRGGGQCGPEVAIATVPRGTHLTLTVQSLAVYTQQGWMTQHGRTVVGPWRIPFVMP